MISKVYLACLQSLPPFYCFEFNRKTMAVPACTYIKDEAHADLYLVPSAVYNLENSET